MPRTLRFGLMVVALMLAAGVSSAKPRDKKPRPDAKDAPPPLELVVTIDGKDYNVEAGQAARIEIGGRQVELKVTPRPERQFKIAGLSFRYPSTHLYEVDRSVESLVIYTMEGASNVLIVQRFEGNTGADVKTVARIVADGIARELGKENVKTGSCSRILAGKERPGTRMDARIAGQKIIYELYSLPARDATFCLVIQDSPKDDGTLSDETGKVLDLLERTLKLEGN